MDLKRAGKFESDRDLEFAHWINHTIGGEKIRDCQQCGMCSATCPFSRFMDYTPRRLMNLSREGFKEEVLSAFSIWLCTSCHACTVKCPKQINITQVMYALKERAIREKFYPKKFPIPIMAREFEKMVYRSGRITESWLVFLIFLKSSLLRLFSMRKMGLRLMLAGRWNFLPEHIEKRGEIQQLIKAVQTAKERMAL
jgi:quinone-modifying oxidoreductase, subunit QmoC